MQNTNSKWYMHPYVCSSIIYNSLILETAQKSIIDKWIKKMWYIHNEILLNIKKEISPLATTKMELESIMLSKISQSEKDKYFMISLICRI